MSNIQIETDLKEILQDFKKGLEKIETKIDNLDQKVNTKIDNLDEKVNTKIDNLDEKLNRIDNRLIKVETQINSEFSNFKEDLKTIKGSQRSQIWSLIGILIVALLGILGTLIRYVFFS